ncbi:MAG: DinB family protein [Longimicrobiales bacterium]
MNKKPGRDEYAEYYSNYVDAVEGAPILDVLEAQRNEIVSLLGAVEVSREGHRYAPGKWSVKDVVAHIVDSERMFAMRALAFARNDPAALPGFEQDDYASASGADRRRLADLSEEFDAVRLSNVLLFRSLEPEAWDRRGIASGNEFSVRGLAWIIAGHAAHHAKVLDERYLSPKLT